MRSPTLPFLRSTSLTSTVRLLAARCFHRPRVPDRLLLLPSECWEERRQVASRFLRSNSQHRNTIGDSFSAGTSARAACRRAAKSCFGSQRRGNGIPGKLPLSLRLFCYRPGLSRSCCVSIVRRQLAEVQSRQRMAELAHVNRFSTAGELTASIAHEINQPLGAILMQRRNRRNYPEIIEPRYR